MLTAIALIPSAPVQVPELAGEASAELSDLVAAVCSAAEALPDRWIAVGVASSDVLVPTGSAGTFGGYGADVRVALSPSTGDVEPLPLCALIAGWVRGLANPRASAEVRAFSSGSDADDAMGRGKALRTELDALAEPVGVLVVADGATTLTPSAPGGHDPASPAVQQALDDALAAGDLAALAALPDAIVGRVAYQVLAGLAAPGPAATRELFRGAPYGVGYFVGVWTT